MKFGNVVRLLTTSALACGTVQPAYADQSEQPENASSAGDIIVTARRTAERLQDVPISITVFRAVSTRTDSAGIPIGGLM